MDSELDSAEKFLFLSIDFKVHPRRSKNLIYLTNFTNRERYKRNILDSLAVRRIARITRQLCTATTDFPQRKYTGMVHHVV